MSNNEPVICEALGETKTLFVNGEILLAVYGAGDCDTIPWPFPTGSAYWSLPAWEKALTSALYDAREMGLIPEVDSVLLPDGSAFTF